MSQQIYSQIVELRNEPNKIKRGRDFEALIREIQPWDHRPPIVSSQDSEQLDGVFTYNGNTFIIESKAIKKIITPGMHEWEDFELKIRRRNKRIIGLYCSLNEVSEAIEERAKELNSNGYQTIIIAGKNWEELNNTGIHFPSFLDYLLLLSSIKFKSRVDSIKKAQTWIYDSETINKTFKNDTWKVSAPFLRRFKHRYHEDLFVERGIDAQIRAFIKHLNPVNLKSYKNKDSAKQIIIIRDFSGSGKTTFTINAVSNTEFSYCFATTANINSIDIFLDNFIDNIKYPNNGIKELLAINKPLIFVIDSLDETPLAQHTHKRQEIKSLIRKVEDLNQEALKHKFHFYPIGLIFTVREEYWRDWEASFEGRQDIIQLKKLLSNFTPQEFITALKNYSKAYNFTITNNLSTEATNILSIPINLEIFAEANHYEGEIKVDDIWEGKILSNYFTKKEEALSKHYLDRFTSNIFYKVLSLLAYKLLIDKTTLFSKSKFKEIASEILPELKHDSDLILLNLISEQIFTTDSEDTRNYRFKYARFIEYLVALYIMQYVEDTSEFSFIDKSIEVIYDSNFVSIYSVLNNIKHISRTQFTEIDKEIINYYSQSESYLKNHLPELRGKIARGECIPDDSIKSIITNFTQTPLSSWNIFFIVSAKKVDIKKDTIIDSFIIAWQKNFQESDRWKLIHKLKNRDLLIEEKILFELFKEKTSPREWEEYFGSILEKNLNNEFIDIWEQLHGEDFFTKDTIKNNNEWQIANRLLDLIYRNEGFILGDIFSNDSPQEYITFEIETSKKLPVLTSDIKSLCDEYILEIHSLFTGNETKGNFSYYRFKNPDKETRQYINIKLESLLSSTYNSLEVPFFNFLVSESPKYDILLRVLIENPILQIPLNNKDINKQTLFIEIVKSQYSSKEYLLEFIFINGYHKTEQDYTYINNAINETTLTQKEYEAVLIGFCFLNIESTENFIKLKEIYREICVILSAKFGRIIYYRFPNFLQVANNAMEHHKEFGDLFIRAFSIYGKYNELEAKPSFAKKVENLKKINVSQNYNYKGIFKEIFPELF
ncbi:hypothetical protein [Flavobacterium sp. NRK1]|uniref:DUF7829 domain-containing protein n=1 Tax=Flavobacterium sp. NRK1 TaxID=2954929 RepID=UPI0020928FB9|nr:hypothetical protein [Flavobacterium sp. NRK1]MCO6148388.1 hypothetical protein [Flavobacterium sp. NRK1]